MSLLRCREPRSNPHVRAERKNTVLYRLKPFQEATRTFVRSVSFLKQERKKTVKESNPHIRAERKVNSFFDSQSDDEATCTFVRSVSFVSDEIGA